MRGYNIRIVVFLCLLLPNIIGPGQYKDKFSVIASSPVNDLTTKPKTGKIRSLGYVGGAESVPAKLRDIYNDKATFFAYENLFTLSYGLTNESRAAIDYTATCIITCETSCQCPPQMPIYQRQHQQKWTPELAQDKTDIKPKLVEVFYFQHGLRFASQKIRDYVANKDFCDVGAFIGDSAYILSKYRPHKIYSYELGKSMCGNVTENVKKLKIDNVTVVINKGISDKKGVIRIRDELNYGLSMTWKGDYEVNVSTIDEERRLHNMKVGFIKADVEGFAVNVLEGARQTIAEDRPVLQIAIYHTFHEYFHAADFIRQFPNYIIDYHIEGDGPGNFLECSLFAYPAEIEYPIFKSAFSPDH